jgi:hypothetical protein
VAVATTGVWFTGGALTMRIIATSVLDHAEFYVLFRLTDLLSVFYTILYEVFQGYLKYFHKKFLSIGEVSKLSGVGIKSLRYYEQNKRTETRFY